ncbi:hypothetical protein QQS21_008780 [Conoideocrella luteorostrata]|uniref:Heterokaryon incompatibility domain-containing protein n=1 Tax=Conoideocrella luteorostrata TaxID=1105319 RepID=A0AAJ0CIC4_9HYPO|nr:hypothetical protein QQS21_008780 [Conoideocrella luteorostrata]
MEPRLSTETFVCELCRKIDFGKAERQITHNPPPTEGIILDQDAARFLHPTKTHCALCKLLSGAVSRKVRGKPGDSGIHELRLCAFSYLESRYGFSRKTKGAQDSVMLFVTADSEFTLDEYFENSGLLESGLVVCYPYRAEPEFLKPRAIPEIFDYGRAKLWIDNCREKHGGECVKRLDFAGPRQLKLIDCETLDIIGAGAGAGADASIKWVALSYVWKRGMKTPFVQDFQKLPRQTSRVVQDAIAVTKHLGYQYLWVDKYCIGQSDSLELDDQIHNMHQIYNNAELTIIAAAGPDEEYGLPGVGSTMRFRQNIVHLDGMVFLSTGPDPALYAAEKSRWWTRGWTFQEGVLSRRRLVFTEHQAFFECSTASWTEAVGGLECIQDRRTVDWSSWKIGCFLLSQYRTQLHNQDLQQGTTSHSDTTVAEEEQMMDTNVAVQLLGFFRLLQQYTTRELTFDADSLNAATGLLQMLAKKTPPTLHLMGLPYIPSDDNQAVLVEPYVFASLSWHHRSGIIPRRRPDFPSWTWAGWAGGIRWMCYPYLQSSRDLKCKFHSVRFQSRDGVLISASDYMQANTSSGCYADSTTAIYFQAQQVPGSMFRMEHDGNDWENVTVDGNYLLVGSGILLPTETPAAFIDRLNDGTWSCLVLGDFADGRGRDTPKRYLLVVQWEGDTMATRVGAILAENRMGANNES